MTFQPTPDRLLRLASLALENGWAVEDVTRAIEAIDSVAIGASVQPVAAQPACRSSPILRQEFARFAFKGS